MNRVAEPFLRPAAAPGRRYTYDELAAELPQTNSPCELWDGELVKAPAPFFNHQKIVFRFQRLLDDWVSSRQLGEVVGAPMDLVLSQHQAVQPDVIFVARERLDIIRGVIHGPADLVAEVLSLGGRTRDRIEKRDLYERHGIKEYWLIDPETETVDVLALVNGRYELAMRRNLHQNAESRLLPGFLVSLAYLFQGPLAKGQK